MLFLLMALNTIWEELQVKTNQTAGNLQKKHSKERKLSYSYVEIMKIHFQNELSEHKLFIDYFCVFSLYGITFVLM